MKDLCFFFVSSFFHHALFGRYFICSFVKTCPITTNKQKKADVEYANAVAAGDICLCSLVKKENS